MSTPFELLRHHKKVGLAAVTGIAVLSFIVNDATNNSGQMSPVSVAALVIGGLALVGWVWGANQGKSGENAIFGGVFGLAITMVFMFMGRPPAAISAATGNISSDALQSIRHQRNLANQMVSRVYSSNRFNRMFGRPPLFGFNIRNQNDDLLITELFNREADELGIEITDDAVMTYLKQAAKSQLDDREKELLTQEIFSEAVQQTEASTPGTKEETIINAIRRELRAQRAYYTLYGGSRMTPADVWDLHRKLNTRQSAQFVGLPVADFIDKDAKPSEADLKQTLEDYKTNVPNFTAEGKPEPGRPGLFLDRRVRVAYLEPNYEEIEKRAGEVTEEEIQARYEKQYKRGMPQLDAHGNLIFPDMLEFPKMPVLPHVPKAPSTTPDPAAPAAPKPADATTPAPGTPVGDKPAEPAKPAADGDKPAAPATPPVTEKPATEKPTTEKPATEKPADPPAKPDGASLRPRASQLQPVVLVEDQPAAAAAPPAEATPAAETPAAPAPEKPAAPATGEKPAEEKPAENKPAADKPAGDKPAETPTTPAAGDKPAAAPLIVSPLDEKDLDTDPPPPVAKVHPLNEEKRKEIRDELLAEKTKPLLEEKVNAARDYMNDLHLNVAEYLDHEKALKDKTGKLKKTELSKEALSPEEATKQLQAYAKKHGLIYTETPLLTFRELLDSEDDPVGGAGVGPQGKQGNVASVLSQTQPDVLYSASTAFDLQRKANYAFWKIEDVKAHIPASLEEPGVKEMVIQAWRTLKARPLAEKRAQELVDFVKKSDKPMAEALAEQTVTGSQDKSLFVTVLNPGEFSWFERPLVSPQSRQDSAPRLGAIQGVQGVNMVFMAKVFDDMQPGSVGVVPNDDRSVYYVTRIEKRTPATEAEIAVMRRQFLESQGDLSRYATEISSSYVGHPFNLLFVKHGVKRPAEDEENDQ